MIKPKISIIVPVYNVENYISKCLDSIINQSYKNLEIIVINDGSVDKSGEICEHYSKKDKRIIFIQKEHQGVSMARNDALDISSGDYTGFVDGDDWTAPDMFDTLYNNAVEYDADISMCNFYYAYQNGKISPYRNENEETKILENIYKIAHNIRLSNDYLWNRLYRRHLFDEIRFPKGKVYEDIFVMHRLIDNANKVVLTAECKYYYFRRENSITLSPFNLNQSDYIEAYIERHNYISLKYPNLEKTSRKFIFRGFLLSINNMREYNYGIDVLKDSLHDVIEKAKHYDFSNCGLSPDQENTLRLIFDDVQH